MTNHCGENAIYWVANLTFLKIDNCTSNEKQNIKFYNAKTLMQRCCFKLVVTFFKNYNQTANADCLCKK